MENIRYNYVIFHRGCFDGFSSFIVLNKSKNIDEKAIIFPDIPSAKHAPPKIDGKDIIVMDVAYKYEVMKELCIRAKSVTFIDHHVTIHDDVLKLQKELAHVKKDDVKFIKIIYDEEECGASLTWKYFFGDKTMPSYIKYIKDNDIGAWVLTNTHPFIAGLETHHPLDLSRKNLQLWNRLFNESYVTKLINKGKIYYEYIDHLLKMNSKRYSMEKFPSEKLYEDYSERFKKPAQYKVAVVCGSGCPSTSMLGLKIMETVKCDFVIIWTLHMDKKEYILSFRSSVVDVGSIAQLFGGGGHKLASACSIPLSRYNIQDLFFPESLPRS